MQDTTNSTPTTLAAQNLRALSAIETRILATIMEKARTVPDSYPLTLNTLIFGCNQKTSREPLMNITDSDAITALEALKQLNLVREVSGGRTARFEHNFQRAIGVPEQSAVILGLLMLRGAQTAAELRLNTERWYKFADISSVEGFLDEMQNRADEKGGALVVKLPRAPGTREQRWAHLLNGPIDLESHLNTTAAPSGTASPHLESRIAELETQVEQLKAIVQKLCSELGIDNGAGHH